MTSHAASTEVNFVSKALRRAPHAPCSCAVSVKAIMSMNYLTYLVQASKRSGYSDRMESKTEILLAFSAMRVYALQRSRILCAITFILSIVPVVTSYVGFFLSILLLLVVHIDPNILKG